MGGDKKVLINNDSAKIQGTELIGHSVELADTSVSEVVIENMLKTINTLVSTGIDVIVDPELLKSINAEFEATMKG